ncbi:MAG TPA: helix-hairpin-helix domain-containing protein [Meiothermus sp.]|nr:helix-hairpin-helix domain-containing protein [Meiothermus sp.]
MNRKELSGLLEYAADLLEVLGEYEFRAQAYRRVARTLDRTETDLETLAARNFEGIAGPSLAPMLVEIVQNGEFPYLAELESRIPPGVLEMFRVRGLGPKRIRALWDNHIDSLEELVRHAEEGKLRGIPGFGAKTEQNLLEAARFALENLRRVLIPVGLGAAQLLLADLANAGIQAELTGSLRRGLETVGNVDLIALAEPQAVTKALGQYAEQTETLPWQSGAGNVIHGRVEGLRLKVFCADRASYGTTLFRTTGSIPWLSGLGALPAAPDEETVFAALGKPYVPPFWREAEHVGLNPPERLLKREELVGLIHNHTTYSDGTASLREMARAALERGYEYIVISDHSQSAPYAGGLETPRLLEQWEEIEALNAELAPFRILKSIESDILPDGSLDYPDEVLEKFDLVIGSIHSGFGLSPEAQTERLLRAVDNPYLTILGHATGRLLLRRKGVDADWEAVLERAAKNRVIVEINCNPYRLDVDWRWALEWRERLMFSLGPDSHSVGGMDDIGYGLLMSHKAGLSPEQVVNTWTAEKLLSWRKQK